MLFMPASHRSWSDVPPMAATVVCTDDLFKVDPFQCNMLVTHPDESQDWLPTSHMSEGLKTTPRSDPSVGRLTTCHMEPSQCTADGWPFRNRKPSAQMSVGDGAERNSGMNPGAWGMVAIFQCRPFQCTANGPARRSPTAQMSRLLRATMSRIIGWPERAVKTTRQGVGRTTTGAVAGVVAAMAAVAVVRPMANVMPPNSGTRGTRSPMFLPPCPRH